MSQTLARVRGKVFCQPAQKPFVQFDFVSHGKYLRRAMADHAQRKICMLRE